MQNDHFYIGDIRVERSSRVCAGRIQIKTLHGNVETIDIDLSSLTAARRDICLIQLHPESFELYRRMKEKQLRALNEEFGN
ncbi:hypothetical protein [Thalassospira sp. CH_XMU1420-2]|uniref:hypothetical protein n=1 Tax=Thalassospira sp. CH_XMU1420-2 TaxID=3107769 RepID=UPI00300AA0AE|tara:strand:+ start:9814 stop:10056 length:243 start_codon:yes stop_codon:yes gene_type:complete